ncbi:MAG: hypothetical protein FWF77_04015 [Defluviitaleaceae bacterium]|nr:hypothetical protein [Defluviitaleaceae bacterium]
MKNPAVFIFFGEAYDLREIISKIQANEGGFNLNRVNVYAVARAETAFEDVCAAGEKIRSAFCDEFSVVDFSLALTLTRESCEAARNFLSALARKFALPFERTFVISDKNEHGEILPGGEERAREIIAGLPLLHETDSRFNDALAARTSERHALASAGFWQTPPPMYEENRELHKLADSIELEYLNVNFSEGGISAKPEVAPAEGDEIAKNIIAVPAKPLRHWGLAGRTLKEAEFLMFGKNAERFFEKNYPPENFALENYEDLSLCEAVSMEKKLHEMLVETDIAVKILENEKARAEAENLRPWGTLQGAKIKIGENYALRYELQNLRSAYEKFAEEHAAIAANLDELRTTILRIKKLPVTEQSCKITEAEMLARAEKFAPIAISLLRDDGLLRESHIVKNSRGENCLLRVVGGFSLCDLQRNL